MATTSHARKTTAGRQRKTDNDPIHRARAIVAEAPVDADADLQRLVHQHRELTRRINDESISDQEAEQLGNEQSALEEQIKACPSRSLSDVVAKASMLHDWMKMDPGRGAEGDDIGTLTWSVVDDLLRVGTASVVERPSHDACPTESKGRRYRALLDAAEALGERRRASNDSHIKIASELQEEALTNLAGDLLDATSIEQARSLAGAMFHLMVASTNADRLLDEALWYAERGERPDHGRQAQWKDWGRWCNRSLYAALTALEQHAGVDRTELGGRYLMPRRLDPFTFETTAVTEQ